MKQFYNIQAPGGGFEYLQFDAPVRKLLVSTARGIYIAIPYRDATRSANFYIPPNNSVLIDLQSANGGKGCASLGFSSISSDTAATVYLSVVEYGSDGDNDWYK